MSFGSEMRDLASELTEEFAEEIGKAKLFSLVGETYNDDAGVNTQSWTVHEAFMPEEEIKIGSDFGSQEYAKNHRKFSVAGNDISVIPKQGDLINPSGTTTGHQVIYVDMDMYQAAFILHVQVKPTDLPVVP